MPQWGSIEKIRGQPRVLMDLYKDMRQGRSFSKESGKIRSIQLPSIRYFAYFISKCVLARKVAGKLSIQDLAFFAAALQRDRSYNLGALIAFRLAYNERERSILWWSYCFTIISYAWFSTSLFGCSAFYRET